MDFIKRILPEYSDRIAQDSHLIPFSHLAEEPSEHLIPYMELYSFIIAVCTEKSILFWKFRTINDKINPWKG